MKISINEVGKKVSNLTSKKIRRIIIFCLFLLATISVFLHLLLNNFSVDISSLLLNFFTEVLSVILTVVIIKWLIDIPKRGINNQAKFDLDSLVFAYNGTILNFAGFEEEIVELTELNLKDENKDSFYQYINNSKLILKKIDREKFKQNIENSDKPSIEKLLLDSRDTSEKLEDIKSNFDFLFSSKWLKPCNFIAATLVSIKLLDLQYGRIQKNEPQCKSVDRSSSMGNKVSL